MNNEQIEQPVSMDEQADNVQGNGSGLADDMGSDVNTVDAAATTGLDREGTMPTDMPGDMPGPLPQDAVDNALGIGVADSGLEISNADSGTAMDADAQLAPMDAGMSSMGDVEQAGSASTEQIAPTSNGASTRDVATPPAFGRASDEDDDADSGELVVRPARDPRMDAVASNASMEDLLKASEQQYRTLKHNDVIEGTVMRVDRDEVLVDIGAKTEGIIPNRELQSLTPEEREAMQPGDPVLVAVVQPENNEGHALLSLDRARQERSWRDLQRKFEAGEVIQAPVSGHNKGGLLVNIEGVRGFVPSSQISSLPPGEANKQAELSRYHNQMMPLKIIEINRNRNRLILSERQAMQEQRESMRSRLLQELEPGQVRPGTVTSIADFGAFVDIGGADGLIHLSELSWKRVDDPRKVLKVGDRIDVYVLSVDPNERKIALSLKRTQPEPWSTITDNYKLDQVVRGTITQLTSFGAFARLDDGIEGLIHVSELAEGRVAHPKNVVNEGDVVDLKVIRIDPIKRRIGLSLKRMNEDGQQGMGEPGAFGTEGVYESGAVTSQADMSKPGMEVRLELDPNATPEERALHAAQAPAPEPSQPLPARQAQFQREPQQRDNRDRDRGRDRDRDRDQRGPATSPTGSDEPMSAMAQAFATFAQQQGSIPVAADEDNSSSQASGRSQGNRGGQISQSTTPPQETFAPQASSDAGEMDSASAALSTGTGSTTDTEEDTTQADTGAPGPETEAMGDSGAETVETEASMPSSESIEAAEDDTNGDNTSAAGSETGSSGAMVSLNEVSTSEVADDTLTSGLASDDTDGTTPGGASGGSTGAISGAEGMPSVADGGSVDDDAGSSAGTGTDASSESKSDNETGSPVAGIGSAIGGIIGGALSSVINAIGDITSDEKGDDKGADKADDKDTDATGTAPANPEVGDADAVDGEAGGGRGEFNG